MNPYIFRGGGCVFPHKSLSVFVSILGSVSGPECRPRPTESARRDDPVGRGLHSGHETEPFPDDSSDKVFQFVTTFWEVTLRKACIMMHWKWTCRSCTWLALVGPTPRVRIEENVLEEEDELEENELEEDELEEDELEDDVLEDDVLEDDVLEDDVL